MSTLAPLIDRFGRRHDYLRVSLTDRCNFRCEYCMPDETPEWQPKAEILTLEEIERLVGLFVRLGVQKVRLTGGEPTLRRGYQGLIRRIAPLVPVFMTTNGSTLAEHAVSLREAGLVGVNVSCDSLRRERFHSITHRDSLDLVLRGIDAARDAGLAVKINVVLLKGVNDDEIGDFVRFAATRNTHVRFIEFMPFVGNEWRVDEVVPFETAFAAANREQALIPLGAQGSDVAREFAISGGSGSIGFVSSVTDSFCGSCSRLRLTVDGRLKTCLFLPPRASLRDLMRSGASEATLVETIRNDLDTKWREHPPMDRWSHRDNLTMVQIGG